MGHRIKIIDLISGGKGKENTGSIKSEMKTSLLPI